jgi:hypothetical protein
MEMAPPAPQPPVMAATVSDPARVRRRVRVAVVVLSTMLTWVAHNHGKTCKVLASAALSVVASVVAPALAPLVSGVMRWWGTELFSISAFSFADVEHRMVVLIL